ncbi:MAG: Gx transporter family protein [Lachnospiraceae bacterium]|nr:Gx transporter family protein [Lachnospiraceae bacterium]
MEHSKNKASRIALLGVFTSLAFILGFIESLIPPFTGIPGVKAGFANIVTMVALYILDHKTSSNSQTNDQTDAISTESKHLHGTDKYFPTAYSLLCALGISAVRVLLGGITYNGMSAAMYGITGAVFSLLIMFLLGRTRLFSVTAVSIAGGVAHNAAQLLLAVIMLGNAVLYYLPMLIISGLAAGLIIGLISAVLIRRLAAFTLF